MTKKLISGSILTQICHTHTHPPPIFFLVLPLLDVRRCCKLSLYVISRENNEPYFRKQQKKLTLHLILARLTQIWAPKCFFVGFTFTTFSGRKNLIFKNLALSVTRYNGQLSSCTISEKTNDPILRKFSDGQTDGQRDRRE